MSGGGGSVRNGKPSIKYRRSPLKLESTELAEIISDSYASPSPEISKQNDTTPKENSSGMLSTRELVSVIGHVWDSATGPLRALLDRSSSRFKCEDTQNGDISYSTIESTSIRGISTNGKTVSYSISASPDSTSMVSVNLQHCRAIQKKSLLDHSRRQYSDFWRFLSNRPDATQQALEGVGLGCIGVCNDLRKVYGWMGNANKNFVVSLESMNEGHIKSPVCATEDCNNVVDITSSVNTAMIVNADHLIDDLDNVNLALVQEVNPVITTLASSTTIQGENNVRALQSTGSNTSIQSMRSQADCNLTLSADWVSSSEETKCRLRNEDVICDEIYQPIKATNHSVQSEFSLSYREKSHTVTAEKKHAVAGAMAGASVSLCLHPIDTIKTVVQSCRANQSSLHQIGKSIISERGITGLYRGISSNIASSAPISAIYTFTYESVKNSLLPLFPKEYQSLAHCMAGGCASIATSFVFTPSECIKQQMQIGSHYQNCWNALIKIIEKGGFSSLYAGWGAVLCRNVPHSIIKFYTYESLKQLIFPAGQLSDSVRTNTLLTLICGGLSGSNAALFTTPFDVVKTRLQTQIPGSKNHYKGVLYTLKHIWKNEGMKGLYRGLTPRLFMYMTQGALFFTSYESFKRLFSSDVPALDAQ